MSTLSILSLFGRFAGPFPVPVEIQSAVARSRRQGRPLGRRDQRLALDGGEHGRRLIATEKSGKAARRRRALWACVAWIFVAQAASAPAAGQDGELAVLSGDRAGAIAGALDEAVLRFGLPRSWLQAVMRVESGGRVAAVSPKGAMGLMQLMPATWQEMRREHDLGDDPFEPRANILAGAAYLRRMHDRFGAPGFLAAYNAGPARYESFLAGRQGLPSETVAYVRQLAPRLLTEAKPVEAKRLTGDWRVAGLFAETGDVFRVHEAQP